MTINHADLDEKIRQAVFGRESDKKDSRQSIRDAAKDAGIYPASTYKLYQAAGQNKYEGITVPAINIRGITYDFARAVFRAAIKSAAGAYIFELARSEMGYTLQTPDEYAVCILAAALRENYTGPVYIQGDHYQVRRAMYRENAAGEIDDLKTLIRDSVYAGFYNIDIDASTLVDITQANQTAQQEANGRITAELCRYIREIQPEGITVTVGGEIGEIGKGNSTPDELKAFMEKFEHYLGSDAIGISKISVQTGTSHGGVVLPDGSVADVQLDFKTLGDLSAQARKEHEMGGAVQHGASTLPDQAFDMFPKVGTLEVHLATGFQNMLFDSSHFPQDLKEKIYGLLLTKYQGERKADQTDSQYIYKTRKKSFGDFKQEMWALPPETMAALCGELEGRFSFIFEKLNIAQTKQVFEKVISG
ncbi:class II fructose-bisphosphate aldolase [Chloroflexota bacterium]